MPQGKQYTVRDSQTGKTITFRWNEATDPTDTDLEEIFSSARTAAPAVSTRQPVFPPQDMSQPLGEVLGRGVPQIMGRLGGIRRFAPLAQEEARLAGTGLELAMPFAAAAPGARIPMQLLLAGLGQAGGTLARQNLEDVAKIQSGGQPMPLEEKLQESAVSGLYGAGGQLVGAGAARGAQKMAAPFSKQVNPDALAMSRSSGIRTTPSEVLDERGLGAQTLKMGERVTEQTLTGGAVIRQFKEGRTQKLVEIGKKTADDFIAKLEDPATVKRGVVDALEASESAFQVEAGKLYKNLEKLSKNTTVDIRAVKAFAKRELNKIPPQARVAAGAGGVEASQLLNQLENIGSLPDNVSFSDAQFWRSQLLSTVRADKSPIGGRVKGTASKSADLFDYQMRKSAETAGILSEYQSANQFYREGKELFNDSFLKTISDREPERLASSLIRPRNLETVKTVKKAISTDAFQKVKRSAVEDWIQKAVKTTSDSGDQFFDGKTLVNEWKNLGEATRQEIFSFEERAAMEKFINFAVRTPSRERGLGLWGTSQVFAGGAAVGLGQPVAAAGLFLAPAMFAKLITSKTGRQFLTEGYKIRPGTQEAMKFIGRLNAYLAKESE